MLMEPLTGDTTEDNLGPVGRVAYAFSTMACVPVSLSQEVGLALGVQAGQAKLTEVIKAGGFTQVRRAAEAPVNMVLEADPEIDPVVTLNPKVGPKLPLEGGQSVSALPRYFRH